MACEHKNFAVGSQVFRLTDDDGEAVGFMLELVVQCADCGAGLGFKGLPCGASTARPMVSPTGREARLPLLSPAELELAGPLPGLGDG